MDERFDRVYALSNTVLCVHCHVKGVKILVGMDRRGCESKLRRLETKNGQMWVEKGPMKHQAPNSALNDRMAERQNEKCAEQLERNENTTKGKGESNLYG